MQPGNLIFVFHGHLPYVLRTESGNSLQERWLYEAVVESYLPLLVSFDRLRRDGVPFRATFSLTPTLLGMLSDPDYSAGTAKHLSNLVELSAREEARTRGTEYHSVASWYAERLYALQTYLNSELDGDVLNGFRRLSDSGHLELITSAATHGYLPLMKSDQSVRTQIRTGVREFQRLFGRRPDGLWLPECGLRPGVEEILAAEGISFCFTDSHVIENARPRPRAGVYRPVLTPAGVAAFGRDRESSRQVWDRHAGYPGDYHYREFYRDIGWDLPMDYIAPYVLDGGIRSDTGLKYHRITGPGVHKEVYDPYMAQCKAEEHARHFVGSRQAQVRRLAESGVSDPVIVAPYDAELFGHWWFEGPYWVEQVYRAMVGADGIRSATPSDCLRDCPPRSVVNLSMGSWGAGGYNEVWLNGANDWMYPHLHRAEERMAGLAKAYPQSEGLLRRALNQAARELLLAQSSDWPFMITMNSAPDYAADRARLHLDAFESLYNDITGWTLKESSVALLEQRDRLFPEVDYRNYAGFGFAGASMGGSECVRVLMLTWEYPPFVVGGLGHHVAGLARGLCEQGDEVTVLTANCAGAEPYTRSEGLEVWRVGSEPDRGGDFLGWVYSFNEALVKQACALMENGGFDLIHAHDWLVGPAATALKQRFGLPLTVTIHATEHGRNGGLFTDLQHAIHREEWRLCNEANRIIACSKYMVGEVTRLFAVPAGKAVMIPNGIDPEPLELGFSVDETALEEELAGKKTILFVGRLVAEKGVQVLLRAVPAVLQHHPDALFLIAGRGPYEGELRALAAGLGVGDRVRFLGFIEETQKQRLMRQAHLITAPSLYEPFGIIALEAMASGTPIVASSAGGLDEIVDHRQTGLKVPPGDHQALAAAIMEVLADETLARGMAARAAMAVREYYSWEAISEVTEAVYKETIYGAGVRRNKHVAIPRAWKRAAACYV